MINLTAWEWSRPLSDCLTMVTSRCDCLTMVTSGERPAYNGHFPQDILFASPGNTEAQPIVDVTSKLLLGVSTRQPPSIGTEETPPPPVDSAHVGAIGLALEPLAW